MKKVLLISLVIAVLLSCVNITAFAEDQNSKITTTLAEKLDKLSEGEKIETCIWLYYKQDAELIERETFKECGLTAGTCMTLEEVDIYSKTYNRIGGELEAKGNKALIEKTGVPNEDIVFCSTASPLIILNLTKEQIYTISTFEEVQSLDYDNTIPADEPSQSDLPYEPLDPIDLIWLEVVREYYLNNSIMSEDITTDFRIPVGGNIYVVKFTVAGYDYSDVITETQIGEYTLRSNEPQPLILHAENKKLYTFEDAYQQEVINDSILADVSSFKGMVDLTKSVEPSTNETVLVTKPTEATQPSTEVTIDVEDVRNGLQTCLCSYSAIIDEVEYFGMYYENYYEFRQAYDEAMRIAYHDDDATAEECLTARKNLENSRNNLVRTDHNPYESIPEPTETSEPSTDVTETTELTAETTQPTAETTKLTEPNTTPTEETKLTEPNTNPTEENEPTEPAEKKVNPVKVTVNKITVNAKKLTSKKQTVKPITVKNAKGQVEVVKEKSGTNPKIYKKITVNKKTGAITFSKGKYSKKTYNIKLKITAKGNSKYKAKTVVKTVTVKVK